MKILIFSSSYGQYGGIEAFVAALASAVTKWPEFEVQVCFKILPGHELAADWKTTVESQLDCPIHYIRRGESKLLKLIRWADLVHVQNVSPDVVFPSWFLRKKIVLTIHNWHQRKFGLHSILWRAGARLADRRWYNSKFVWNTWEPGKKLKGSECVPTVCRFPDAWCPPEERKGFLFVGRWIENKGIEELVEAYARLGLDRSEWPLTILGDGPLRSKIVTLVKEAGLNGIEMPGFVDDESKAKYIASARWLVAPAKTLEDMGLTPIEARSVGVPAIVTRDGGLPESAGDAALIVEPGNIDELAAAMRQAVLMSNEEYERRGERGRESLKEYLKPMEFYRYSYQATCERI